MNRKEYLAILGPRQAGKTTLLGVMQEHLLKEGVSAQQIHQMTFEDKTIVRAFEGDPVRFIKPFLKSRVKTFLFMDEFQYVEDGGQKLKLIYDTIPDVKIVVTGSSSLDLKGQVGKYMVGRMLFFNLHPFNFHEFLETKDPLMNARFTDLRALLNSFMTKGDIPVMTKGKIDPYEIEGNAMLEEYCIWGGYPAVVLESSPDVKMRILRDIYSTFVLRDVKDLLALATDRELSRLSEYLATQIGNILVYKNLSQTAGLDFRSMKRHLAILEETFTIHLLRPFWKNRQKELSKNPKVYFEDLGIRNSLMNNLNQLHKRSDAGSVIENFVFRHIEEQFETLGKLNFWRSKTGTEVDFIIGRSGELLPVEVKYSAFEVPQISRSLASFIRQYAPPSALVLTKNFLGSSQIESCRVIFAPVYYV